MAVMSQYSLALAAEFLGNSLVSGHNDHSDVKDMVNQEALQRDFWPSESFSATSFNFSFIYGKTPQFVEV